MKTLSWVFVSLSLFAYSCKVPFVLDTSAFALESGDHTMALGGCERALAKGYDDCQITKDSDMPNLRMAFVTDAEYAVSDCQFGIYKTGSVKGPSVVEVDLSGLSDQIKKAGFCLLRAEAIEHYPDPLNKAEIHDVPLAGGWFVEVLSPEYFPVPDPRLVQWCYQVKRTSKGRTTVEKCK